jgi:adenylate kinase family enzyme
LAAGERWIMEGYHRVCLDIRLRAADEVVFLDFPRRTCLWRVMKRWLRHRGRTRPDMGAHCPEKLDLEFLRYIWSFNRLVRPGVMDAIRRSAGGTPVHLLKSNTDVKWFLAVAAMDARTCDAIS